ncbi:MAG: UTRA domain-containing protein, partial [Christensenellales bacterium]
PATKDISNHLNIPMGTLVYRLERIQVLNDIPYAFIKNYIRCDLTPGLEQYSGQSDKIGNLYRLMQAKYGVVFATGKENISTQLCSLFDSKILGTNRNTGVVFTANRFHHNARSHGIRRKADSSDILNLKST